jgi:hypothetical protein
VGAGRRASVEASGGRTYCGCVALLATLHTGARQRAAESVEAVVVDDDIEGESVIRGR